MIRFGLSVLFFRCDDHEHPFALEARQLFRLAVFEQRLGEFEQLCLTLFLVDNRAATEKHVDLDLVALFEETDGVVELELEVVVVGLRREADFLDDNLLRVGLALLVAFLLFV